MTFARKVWHLLVAIKDGLVLLFMLLFFMALYAALTARPSAGQVREGALLLKLSGSVVEEPAQQDPFALLLSDSAPTREYRARDLVLALRAAAKDDRIKAVVLDLSRFTGGGQVHMEELASALDAVRGARKPVLTYATLYMDDAVFLAAHSTEVWVDPLGGAAVTGPGGQRLYFRAFLDRFKITPHVFKVGTYKDAVEPYLDNAQSAPSKEAVGAIYAALWENWTANVAKARPKADIARVTSDPVGWSRASGGDLAKAALAAGLVDKIGDEVAFGERVRQLVGKDPLDDAPGAFAHTLPKALLAAHTESTSGKPVAVVTVAGEIVDGKAGPGSAGGERIAKLIDEANSDEAPALVLRVDSPGGSVMASEQIRTALERFKQGGHPVVVSMANLAASGGYWVSTPAQTIFAEPATITGSIGIFAVFPSFERALAEYGITADGVRTTPLSGQPDLIAGLTPEVEQLLQANVEAGYGRFIGLVAKSRGKTPEQVDSIAQGRVWDGGTARQLGLVDRLGGLDDALAEAARAAKLGDDWHPQFYGKPTNPYASLLERLNDQEAGDEGAKLDLVGSMADRQQLGVGHLVGGLERLLGRKGAQAYCLDCPVAPVEARRALVRQGWLAQLAALVGIS